MAIAVNAWYAKKYIYPAYISKNHSNCEKQVILLMIPNGDTIATGAMSKESKAKSERRRQQWHYVAVKKNLSALLREITPKYHVDSYFLNCLHCFVT